MENITLKIITYGTLIVIVGLGVVSFGQESLAHTSTTTISTSTPTTSTSTVITSTSTPPTSTSTKVIGAIAPTSPTPPKVFPNLGGNGTFFANNYSNNYPSGELGESTTRSLKILGFAMGLLGIVLIGGRAIAPRLYQ